MEYGKVCLHRGEEKDIAAGSLWIYDNEIDWVDDICRDGDVVEVVDSHMRFVARGFFNSRSKITVRILTLQKEEINWDFFYSRISRAWQCRRELGFENSCRVVFGESDGLPGLTVDKFADCLSLQIVSLGMDACREEILSVLTELFHPRGIYEKDDIPVRKKEGLPRRSGCLYGTIPGQVEIMEHDAKMLVDIAGGQKTGHFLDQQENRGRIRPYAGGRTVLDLCTHTGGFAIHAALYGASRVEAVDVSREALDMVEENARRNGVCVETVCDDVFELVRRYADEGKTYGTVICDPPAFAKSKGALQGAYRGYKELNLRCMKLVEKGGYLITLSCSQFMTPELFLRMLREAAADCGRRVQLLESLIQSRDHPAALNAEQALYLKGYILRVL